MQHFLGYLFTCKLFNMAWHITWILWVIFALVELIVKLIFSMKEEKSKKITVEKGSDEIEKVK